MIFRGVGMGFIMHCGCESAFCRDIADIDTNFLERYLELVWLFVKGQKDKINRENSIIKNFYQEVSVI